MSGVRFIEFHSIRSKCLSNSSRTCVQLLSSGEQCQVPFEPNLLEQKELQSLWDMLQADSALDELNRAKVLEQVARHTVCYAHGEDEDIDAAVSQWNAELQSRASTPRPQTPIAAKVPAHEPLSFSNYHSPKRTKKLETLKGFDLEIRKALAGSIEIRDDMDNHLYVFSDRYTRDAYKVGRGKHLDRPIQQQKCYRKHQIHIFVKCPNAKLFEKVVHAELALHRRIHECNSCGKKHQEWFEASLPEILEIVMTWSNYAIALYKHGLAFDGNLQRLPLPGFSDRPDRWQSWAMEEVMRWKKGNSGPIAAFGETPAPEKISDMKLGDTSDSDTASTVSSAASVCDTPGTTPATTPGSFGNDKDDYGLSPTPAARYNIRKPAETVYEENDDFEEESEKPVERALFNRSSPDSPSSPTISAKEAHSNETESLQSKERSSTDSVSESSTTGSVSRTQIDKRVRDVLERHASHACNPGTIYLTPPHPEKESHKIYCRQGKSQRSRECYSNPKPYLRVRCTNAVGIQELVLAEFDDWTHKDTCGRGCTTEHKYWINRPGDSISASVQAWAALMDTEYDIAQIPGIGFSRDADRWTKWAEEMAASRTTTKTGAVGVMRRVSTFFRRSGKPKK